MNRSVKIAKTVLDRQEIDSPFCADPRNSYTMPARYYYDAEIHELEKRGIFYRSWWYAGHVSQIPP